MTYNSYQYALSLQLREARDREDFVVGESNKDAITWIDKYPNWQNNGLIIVGPKSSGKSHLVKVWQKSSSCSIVKSEDIDKENKNLLDSENIAIEDFHNVSNFHFLLHLFNYKSEKKCKLLLTSRLRISEIDIKLKDIKSRLTTLPQAFILMPTDDVIKGILYKLFKDKGVILNEDIIKFILMRTERTYMAVNKLANDANRISLQRKKKITIPLIREIIEI